MVACDLDLRRKLLVVIGMLCLLVGCRPPKGEVSGAAPKASDTLVAIDSLMWSRPDSAFALLQEHFDPEQPYAQLLLAELLYKNDYAQTNRTELLRTVAHYDSLCDAFLDARAHYINGVGYYENDSVVEACQEYLKALEVMEEHFKEKELVGHRARFMALTYNHLGGLFSDQFMVESAISCYENGLVYCIIEPTSPVGVSKILSRLGQLFDMKNDPETALNYYEKAIENSPDTNNSTYRDALTGKALVTYELNNDAAFAIGLLESVANKTTNENEKCARNLIIGDVYFEEGNYDSALFYLETSFNSPMNLVLKTQAAEFLSTIYDSLGDEEKKTACIRFLAESKQLEGDNKVLVSQLEHIFQNHNLKTQERIAGQRKRRTLGVILPLTFVLAALIYSLTRRFGKKQLDAQLQTHRTQQTALSARLKSSNQQVMELKKQLKQLNDSECQNKQADTFFDEPICRLIMERVHEGQFKSRIDYNIYKSFALDKNQLAALRLAADRHFDHFTNRLQHAYPKLTLQDFNYCCLYLLGLTEADIAALMQRAYSTVFDRTQKLKALFHTEQSLYPALQTFANGDGFC